MKAMHEVYIEFSKIVAKAMHLAERNKHGRRLGRNRARCNQPFAAAGASGSFRGSSSEGCSVPPRSRSCRASAARTAPHPPRRASYKASPYL